MSFCGFTDGAAMFDSTPIENMFFIEYLPTAPDGFLRVYLYGRMLCLHPELGESLSDMAQALKMSEDEVLNAFSYWEQQSLVEKMTDNPPSYSFRTLNNIIRHEENSMDRDYYRYRWYNSALQEMFGSEHLLQPKQYAMANDWLTVLNFEEEAALRLLKYEYEKGRGKEPASVFRRADKRALEWAERGIHTLAEVEAAIAYDDRVYTVAAHVMKQLSLRRSPTVDELNTVRCWLYERNLSEEEIIAGCAKTTASRTPSIAYLDAILRPDGNVNNEHFEAVKTILKELGGIGVMPTPDQCKTFGELLSEGFEQETLFLSAAQCARKGKHRFDDFLWMVRKWGDAGVHTYTEAEQYLEDMNRARTETHEIMTMAGLSRRPNADDIERYLRWKNVYPMELIRCAAELANGTNVPTQYMGKLLERWAEAGITTAEAARAASPKTKTNSGSSNDPGFQVHDRKAEDFSDSFFYNFDPGRKFPQEDNKQ